MKHLQFTDEHGSFSIEQPENTSYLYFPLASEKGLKSSVTPNLGGDAKIDQETFLLEPVSAENLHNNRSVRNFWLVSDTGEIFSASGASAQQEASRFTELQDDSRITAGFMWHSMERISKTDSLRRSSCLRAERRQYTGSQKCNFHAPPHPHGIPRGPCPPDNVL